MIIDFIIAHNNATELHDLKWEITLNTLKDLVAPLTTSQRLIQQAILQRQTEIDAPKRSTSNSTQP